MKNKCETWDDYHMIQDNWIPKLRDPINLRDSSGLPQSWGPGFTGRIIKIERTDDPVWCHYPNVRLLTVQLDAKWRNGSVIVNGMRPKKIQKVLSVKARLWTDEVRKFKESHYGK